MVYMCGMLSLPVRTAGSEVDAGDDSYEDWWTYAQLWLHSDIIEQGEALGK